MGLPIDTASASLAAGQLQAAIEQFEREASAGRFNTLCIRSLGGAATVLGEGSIADRAVQLLRTAPDDAFWAGAIKNFELPAKVPDSMRTVDASEALERQHPPYRLQDVVKRIQTYSSTDKHFAHCLHDHFEEALSAANSGGQLEEVANTLNVLGEIDNALRVAQDPALETFRQRTIRLVAVIELFRRGRADEATALLTELESAGLDASDRVHLALGLAGREPWGDYPYSDW